jgi:hypothetical protein
MLTVLTIFAIRRSTFKYPEYYDGIFERISLPSSLKPFTGFKKTQTIYDEEFLSFCSN